MNCGAFSRGEFLDEVAFAKSTLPRVTNTSRGVARHQPKLFGYLVHTYLALQG